MAVAQASKKVTRRQLSPEELQLALDDILFGKINETKVFDIKSNEEEGWGVKMEFSHSRWYMIRVRGLRPNLQFARLGIKKGYRLHRYEDLILGEENRKQIQETMITGRA